jgi:DNA-binding NtrC family response regulator
LQQRVLVVDDERLVARALERWLRRHGVEVSVLCESASFSQEFARVRPTAVVSDYLMPGADGVSLLRQCRQTAPEVKRCLLSGSLAMLTEEQRESISPCLFLAKPWNDEALERLLGFLNEP